MGSHSRCSAKNFNLDLFESQVPKIPGLNYVRAFLSGEEQQQLLRRVDDSPWQEDLDRRVQHYGWRYDYRARSVSRDMRIGDFPPWLQELAKKLCQARLCPELPDQAIINEYLPGQGIAMHIDRQCFGPVVVTVSLGDAWEMVLRRHRQPAREAVFILLDPGSALILSAEARSQWLHGITPRKRERLGNHWRPRTRRVSVTFRTVLVD